jgi:hypothetical protein
MTIEASKETGKEESGFYEPYSEFARILRTWFIAYGIGVPVLLLTSQDCWRVVVESGNARSIGLMFLGGVSIQVIMALVYKTAMWQLYSAELHPEHKKSRLYRLSDRLSDQYALEFIMDLITLGFFGWATVKALMLVTQSSQT